MPAFSFDKPLDNKTCGGMMGATKIAEPDMQHLTDTSDAWDREGERADSLADAITTEAERIVRDKDALRGVIEGWLIESDTDIAELLAMLVASRLPHSPSCPLPSWATEGLESALRQIETNIAAEVDKEARFSIEGARNEQ